MAHTSFRQAAESWLLKARATTAPEGEIDLAGIAPEELTILAADLEGIHEASGEVARRLLDLLGVPPSPDRLDDELIEAEILLKHALWHWQSIRQLLVTRGVWVAELDPDEDNLAD